MQRYTLFQCVQGGYRFEFVTFIYIVTNLCLLNFRTYRTNSYFCIKTIIFVEFKIVENYD